jgi:hypothetical protein
MCPWAQGGLRNARNGSSGSGGVCWDVNSPEQRQFGKDAYVLTGLGVGQGISKTFESGADKCTEEQLEHTWLMKHVQRRGKALQGVLCQTLATSKAK